MFCCVIFGYFSCFICNCLFFRATSLLFVLVQRCFVDSSVHSFINYIDKIIPTAFVCNLFFQSLKITISELYAKHLRSAITLLLSINQTVQISIISPFCSYCACASSYYAIILVPRAHVSFGQRQDTELWNNQLRESKILGLPVSRCMRALV